MYTSTLVLFVSSIFLVGITLTMVFEISLSTNNTCTMVKVDHHNAAILLIVKVRALPDRYPCNFPCTFVMSISMNEYSVINNCILLIGPIDTYKCIIQTFFCCFVTLPPSPAACSIQYCLQIIKLFIVLLLCLSHSNSIYIYSTSNNHLSTNFTISS